MIPRVRYAYTYFIGYLCSNLKKINNLISASYKILLPLPYGYYYHSNDSNNITRNDSTATTLVIVRLITIISHICKKINY